MIADQEFHCPKCGAPGQVRGGTAEYTCLCRMGTYEPTHSINNNLPKCPSCGEFMFSIPRMGIFHQCPNSMVIKQVSEE